MQKTSIVTPNNISSRKNGASAFHVLELAGDGAELCNTYGSRFVPEKNVIIRALCRDPIESSEHRAKAKSYSKNAILPDCLENEKSGYFSHIHFHMIDQALWPESPTIFSNLHRLLKDDGILFFSGDIRYFGDAPLLAGEDTRWISNALEKKYTGVFTLGANQAIQAVHHKASEYFDVLFALGMGNRAASDPILKVAKQESFDIAELFGWFSAAPSLFKFFSNYVPNPLEYCYFLVGRKKEVSPS